MPTPNRMKRLLDFPNPVNETSARLVAGGVVVMVVATLATQSIWILGIVVYGFWARVLTGPKLSPLAFVVTRYVTPRLHWKHKYCAGPPKRFAQGIGATFSTAALVAFVITGWSAWTITPLAAILVAATLESVLGFCIGCYIFGILMDRGLIPERICERCANLNLSPS